MELRAAHDERGVEVEGLGGVCGRKIGDLFADELVGLRGDVAADQSGLQYVEGDVLAGCGWRLVGKAGAGLGGENGLGVFGVGSVRSGGWFRRAGGLRHEAEGEDVGGVELLVGEFVAGEGVGEVEAVDEGG